MPLRATFGNRSRSEFALNSSDAGYLRASYSASLSVLPSPPAGKIAHGYEKAVRLSKGQNVAEGIMTNYSYHAGSLKLKTFGGDVRKILFRRGGVKVQELKNHSWMPPASKMGLNDQDVRDIAEYLKNL